MLHPEVDGELCTPEGDPGSAWHERWGTLQDYASSAPRRPQPECAFSIVNNNDKHLTFEQAF